MMKGSILVVDDNPLVRMNTVDTLMDAGYSCSTADSVASGWSLLSNREFNLVVCDHDLSDGKGSVLARRHAEAGGETPFVFLSAAGSAVAEQLSATPCVKRVLHKPASTQDLLSAISDCFSKDQDGDLHPRLIGNVERESLLGPLSSP